MSCSATGPINIVHTDKRCNNKCLFNYNFKKTQVNAKNKGSYVSIEILNNDSIIAEYSSTNTPLCKNGGYSELNVKELRVYSPSIHTYGKDKKNTDAELIIMLNNTTGARNLVICIPISTLNGTLPTATDNLTNIIKYLSQMGNNINEGGTIRGLNFDLNKFIPQKGFYSYAASLPWEPCQKCTDYIVYDKKDAVINLSNQTISLLNNIIKTKHNIDTVNIDPLKIGYSYNKKGASSGFGRSDDEIYIDCRPTGSSGVILVDEDKNNILSNNEFGMFSGISQDKYERYKMFGWTVALTIITVFALIFSMTSLYTIFFGSDENIKKVRDKLPFGSNRKR